MAWIIVTPDWVPQAIFWGILGAAASVFIWDEWRSRHKDDD